MTAVDGIAALPPTRRPACVACGKAKRKCSKQVPACRRCHVKKLRCAYPVVTQVVLSPDTDSTSRLQAVDDSSLGSRDSPFISHLRSPQRDHNDTLILTEQDLWFLSPSSWEIDHLNLDDDNRITYPESGLDFFLDQLKTWLDQWTRDGHCPFIHPRLYSSSDLPSPLQHAHAAWVSYRAATTATGKKIALKTATDWAKTLVQEQSVLGTLSDATNPLDLVSHLSRTQALLVFQVMGLFDGAIRARAEAQNMLSTLQDWANGVLHCAAANAASYHHHHHHHHHPLIFALKDQNMISLVNSPRITDLRLDHKKTAASAWRSWVLSESIRRTWNLAGLTGAAFLIYKHGQAVCPGSIAFSARSGLWDARTPRSWLGSMRANDGDDDDNDDAVSISTTKNPVTSKGLDRLLDEALPSDVDEFTKALLAYARGKEALEDWEGERVSGQRVSND